MNPYVTSMWVAITIASYVYIFKIDERNSVAPKYVDEKMQPEDWFVYPVPKWQSVHHIDAYGDQARAPGWNF